MTLFQLEVLVAVADHGSFTRAGEEIGLSQSGVSHTIAALERELGIHLFNRNRNGISLTSSGQEALKRARTILSETKQIKQLATASATVYKGTVRIGSFPSATRQLVPPLLRSMRKLYPQMEARVLEGSYQEIAEWVDSGIVDLGFLTLPADDLTCDVIPLQKDPLRAILPIGHALSHEASVTLEQLSQEPFILPMAGCEHLLQLTCQELGVQLNVRHEVAENATILSMVEAGVGVSIVPRLTLPEDITSVVVLDLESAVHRQIILGVKSLTAAPANVQAWIAEVQRLLSQK
jgi:DNA-binding transcriptional LysR family regulator